MRVLGVEVVDRPKQCPCLVVVRGDYADKSVTDRAARESKTASDAPDVAADDELADATQVTGTGYTAGGVSVTNGTEPTSTSTTAHWTPSTSIIYTTVTLNAANFNAVLLYNSTQGDKAIAVYTFGAQTITAGTFTLTMPTNDGTTGLLRLA